MTNMDNMILNESGVISDVWKCFSVDSQ